MLSLVRTLIASALLLSGVAGDAEAKRVCLMLCPTVGLAQCTLSWDPAGDCSCKCKGLDFEALKAEVSKDAGSGLAPSLALRAVAPDRLMIVPMPATPARGDSAPSSLAVDAAAKAGEGGGGTEPRTSTGTRTDTDTRVSPAEVERLIKQIIHDCQRGGC